MHESIGGNPLVGLSLADLREAIDFPEFLPPVEDISAMSDGTVWPNVADDNPETTEWFVLDGAGQPLKRVSGPDARITATAGSVAWGIVLDELDVPYVHRYRLRPVPSC